jgi:hypothetical protein
VNLASILKALSKVTRTFTIEIGDFKATGVPAILVGVTGVVLAGGVAAALSRSAAHLPETLREAQGLAKALRRDEPSRLNS